MARSARGVLLAVTVLCMLATVLSARDKDMAKRKKASGSETMEKSYCTNKKSQCPYLSGQRADHVDSEDWEQGASSLGRKDGKDGKVRSKRSSADEQPRLQRSGPWRDCELRWPDDTQRDDGHFQARELPPGFWDSQRQPRTQQRDTTGRRYRDVFERTPQRPRREAREFDAEEEEGKLEGEEFPQCQRYAHDARKLAKCQRKASKNAQLYESDIPPFEGQKESAIHPECVKYAYNFHKLENCQRKFKSAFESEIPSSDIEGEIHIHPQCEHYAYDEHKLAKCQRKASLLARTETAAPPEVLHDVHPQCAHLVYQPTKLAKCQRKATWFQHAEIPAVDEKEVQFSRCQRFANDPKKLAKCERKDKSYVSEEQPKFSSRPFPSAFDRDYNIY